MRRAGARPYGFGNYIAADYDELIDHPVEMGRFSLAGFRACGVPHEIAITGLSAIAARNSADMIDKLNRGLTIEFAFVAAFIGLAFRSLPVALACVPALVHAAEEYPARAVKVVVPLFAVDQGGGPFVAGTIIALYAAQAWVLRQPARAAGA